MKITKLALTIILTTLVFFSCDKSGSGDKLADKIPANSVYVVHIDGKSLAKKANYDLFQNVTVMRGFNGIKAYLGGNIDAVKMLDALSRDIDSLGISFKEDCFFYTDYVTFGFVFKVNDAERIKNALVNFSIVGEKDLVKDDKGIYSISPNNDFAICWNSDAIILNGNMDTYRYYGSGKDEDKLNLAEIGKAQLTQDKAKSINSMSAFGSFMKDKKDISMFQSYANMNFLEGISGMDLPEKLKEQLADLKGVSALGFISFENGEIIMDNKVLFENSDVEKKYKDLVAQMTDKLNGDQLKYMVEKPLFLFAANIKGAGVYNYLDNLGLASKLQESIAQKDSTFSIKSFLEYFNGDLSFAFNNIETVKKSYSYGSTPEKVYEYDSTEPVFVFLADVKDGKGLSDLIVKTVDDEEFVADGENAYTFNGGGQTYHMGIADSKTFYITNDKNVVERIKSTDLKNNYSGLVKGNFVVVHGELSNIKDIAKEEISDENIQSLVAEGLDLLGAYDYAMAENMTGKGKLIINDKSKNSFSVICHYIDKVLTKLNDEVRF